MSNNRTPAGDAVAADYLASPVAAPPEMTDEQALSVLVQATRHPSLVLNYGDRAVTERALERIAALVGVATAKDEQPAKLAAAK